MARPPIGTLPALLDTVVTCTYTGSDGRVLNVNARLKAVEGTKIVLSHRDGEAHVDYGRFTAAAAAAANTPLTVPQ
jgi:hypothetical protein